MTSRDGSGLRVVMLSYGVTEEAGGPGVAAAGFASGLASLGADVTLLALDMPGARWLVDESVAHARGYTFQRLPGKRLPVRAAGLLAALSRLGPTERATVLWVNGIWGAQSLAAGLAAPIARWPYVVRPAGSLGVAALRYKPARKLAYYHAVESHVLRGASALHCMSTQERDELPPALRARAFVVPSGVEVSFAQPSLDPAEREGPVVLGVLARLHPIKRHGAVLDAVEALVQSGLDVRLELAGSVNDPGYERALRARTEHARHLRGRVTFLGHVPSERVPSVVGRWRLAFLLSEQENFGHAVIAAAAAGVPTVASPGVGLSTELDAAGAGARSEPGFAAAAAQHLLARDRALVARDCLAFARRYAWDACASALLGHLQNAAGLSRNDLKDHPPGPPAP